VEIFLSSSLGFHNNADISFSTFLSSSKFFARVVLPVLLTNREMDACREYV
jgi:hypothetical protein